MRKSDEDWKLWDDDYMEGKIIPNVSIRGLEELRDLFEKLADNIHNGIQPGYIDKHPPAQDGIILCTTFIDAMRGFTA
jgi:hypothetical protein